MGTCSVFAQVNKKRSLSEKYEVFNVYSVVYSNGTTYEIFLYAMIPKVRMSNLKGKMVIHKFATFTFSIRIE